MATFDANVFDPVEGSIQFGQDGAFHTGVSASDSIRRPIAMGMGDIWGDESGVYGRGMAWAPDGVAPSGFYMPTTTKDTGFPIMSPQQGAMLAAMAIGGFGGGFGAESSFVPDFGAENMFAFEANAAAPWTAGGVGGAGGSALGADAIEHMINLSESTGASTWTDAASRAGFNSVENYLSSVNPAWVSQMAGEVPVVEKGRPFNPDTAGGPHDLGNLAAGFSRIAGNSLGFGGASGAASNPFFSAGGPISNAFSVGSGLYGLWRRREMEKEMARAAAMQDPFGPQRAQYQAQLSNLMSNPNALNNLPGYQFGLDEGRRAIQRQGAASGSGGNEAIALARYTPEYARQFRDAEIGRLSMLAGAGIAPSGGNILAQGALSTNDLISRSLASIGYGLRRYNV